MLQRYLLYNPDYLPSDGQNEPHLKDDRKRQRTLGELADPPSH